MTDVIGYASSSAFTCLITNNGQGTSPLLFFKIFIRNAAVCTIHRQRDKPLGMPHTVLWALSTLFTLSDIDCACRYQTFDIFKPSQMTIRGDVTQRPQLPSCEPNESAARKWSLLQLAVATLGAQKSKNIVKIHSHLKFSYIYRFLIKLNKITIFRLLIVFRRVRKIAKK